MITKLSKTSEYIEPCSQYSVYREQSTDSARFNQLQEIRDFGIASNKAARDSIIYSQQDKQLNEVLGELGIEVL